MLNVCFRNTACFSTFVKMSRYNSEEKNMQCILVCFLKDALIFCLAYSIKSSGVCVGVMNS